MLNFKCTIVENSSPESSKPEPGIHLQGWAIWKILLAAAVLICIGTVGWIYKGYLVRMAGWPFLPPSSPPAAGSIRFAVIGDYGSGSLQEGDVARLIKSWKPDFITTVGDNNYPKGAAETIDRNIGYYFHEYIGSYRGKYGRGSEKNRFFPIPGHGDWDTDDLRPYLEYFTLPGNGRYYDFIRGPVHFFMLDTDEREPDGASVDSIQARWLKQKLAESDKPWKLVYSHHAPYTSHRVPDVERMRWPFASWGADAVLSGFYHVYERLQVGGIPYFINGTGGSFVSDFRDIDPNSRFRYNAGNGAMRVDAGDRRITFAFINRKGVVIDTLTLEKGPEAQNE